jgi:hypothetical protein
MMADDRLFSTGLHSDTIDTLGFNHRSLYDVTDPAASQSLSEGVRAPLFCFML